MRKSIPSTPRSRSTQCCRARGRRPVRLIGAQQSCAATPNSRSWEQFAKVHPTLPQDRETVLTYLDRFTTPKYRNSQRDALRALYRYAAEGGVATADPLAGTRGARVPEQPVYTLTLAQVAAADALPMPDRQRAIWELLVGHGWRQVEVQRILATDVRHAADGLIWVRGKVRAEMAPVLPGTLRLLRTLAKGLAADDHIIRSRQSDAVGFDTVHRSATDVLTRAGLSLTIHGLRKTFASLVAEASGDEILAMRAPGPLARPDGPVYCAQPPRPARSVLPLAPGAWERGPGARERGPSAREYWRECEGVEPSPDREAGPATVLKTARPTGTHPLPLCAGREDGALNRQGAI